MVFQSNAGDIRQAEVDGHFGHCVTRMHMKGGQGCIA